MACFIFTLVCICAFNQKELKNYIFIFQMNEIFKWKKIHQDLPVCLWEAACWCSNCSKFGVQLVLTEESITVPTMLCTWYYFHTKYTSLRNKQLLDQAYFFSKNQYIDQARLVRIVLTCTQQLDNKAHNIHLVSQTFL